MPSKLEDKLNGVHVDNIADFFKENKEVYQFDKDCNLINIFPSLKEAAEISNYDKRGICKCCMGVLKTYQNYVWKYV